MEAKRLFTFRIDADLVERLRQRQEETGATPGETIRRALHAYLPPARRRRPGPTETKAVRR